MPRPSPTTDDINADTSTVTGTSHNPHPFPDEGPNPDQLLFDFGTFLEGGALDDVFGIPPDATPKPIPTSDGGGWEVAKLSGGWSTSSSPELPLGVTMIFGGTRGV